VGNVMKVFELQNTLGQQAPARSISNPATPILKPQISARVIKINTHVTEQNQIEVPEQIRNYAEQF
jgi:hypothetical protein